MNRIELSPADIRALFGAGKDARVEVALPMASGWGDTAVIIRIDGPVRSPVDRITRAENALRTLKLAEVVDGTTLADYVRFVREVALSGLEEK